MNVVGRPPHALGVGERRRQAVGAKPYAWRMPLPDWLATINRRVTNPMLRPLAARLPYFGVVLHRGRASGRLYRTPVNAFAQADGFLVALTYGRDVDWVRNVIAEGGCRLVHRGHAVDLVGPRLLPLGAGTHVIPGWIRGILRVLRVSEVLHLGVPLKAGGTDRIG